MDGTTQLQRAALLSGLLLMAAGLAQGRPDDSQIATRATGMTSTEVHFGSLDADRDGLITLQESRANRSIAGAFGQLDRNRDGRLSPDEFSLKVPGSDGVSDSSRRQPSNTSAGRQPRHSRYEISV